MLYCCFYNKKIKTNNAAIMKIQTFLTLFWYLNMLNFLTILSNILSNKLKKLSVNIIMQYKRFILTKVINSKIKTLKRKVLEIYYKFKQHF